MRYSGCTSTLVFVAALGGLGLAAEAHAQADLFSPNTFRAWADVRLAWADGEKSWLDDGFGKLRYGGETKADLAQVAMQWTPHLTDNLWFQVVAQDMPNIEHLGIEEAYLKWRPMPVVTPLGAYHFTLRAGQMFPPVSMEHDGAGWTTTRTLTPSAINTWVGEELLVEGLEGSVITQAGDQTFGATVGVFSKDDTAGTMLAWRGWALHDVASDNNSELPLPSGPQGYDAIFGDYQAYDSRSYDEVDHRLGYYVRADWRPPAAAAFNLEYYNNQGDPEQVRNGQWAWATHFWNLGAQYRLSDRDILLSQVMSGGTATGWEVGGGYRVIDVGFDSAYLLLSHDLGQGAEATGRVDFFEANDHSWQTVDDNNERGYALTVAWRKPVTAHLDFTLEGVQVWSNRPARVTQMLDPRQAQTELQMAFKLHL